MSNFYFAAILFAAILAEPQEKIFIRVKNKSRHNLKNLEVNSPSSGRVYFGNIASGQTSGYKTFSNAYRIAAVTAEIEGKKVEFLPDDYLGEQHLKSGKYTYEITVVEASESNYLRLKFIIDKE